MKVKTRCGSGVIARKRYERYLIDEARRALGLAMRSDGRSNALRLVGVNRAKAAKRREYRIETGQNLRAFPPPSKTRQAHSELHHMLRDYSFQAFTLERL